MIKRIRKHLIWIVILLMSTVVGIGTVYAAETESDSVESAWVIASAYKDGSIIFDGATSATMTAKVPYFDLTNYDLQDYVLKDDNGDVVEKPTLLHALIYLIEKYSLQGETDKLGTGYYKEEIFQTERTGQMEYYVDTSQYTVKQNGGTMLALNSNGKVTSLLGFCDCEIRIYINQTQRKWLVHKLLLEDVNTLELMVISEDNDRTILYPHFFKNAFQIQVGESITNPVTYYDVDGASYSLSSSTKLCQIRHMEGLESFDVNVSGDSASGTIEAGPFNYVGIYKAKVIFYPFYYKQLIEVRDTISKVVLNDTEGHFSTEITYLSQYKADIKVVPDEYYDFSANVKVTLGEDGEIESVTKNEDGTLTVCVNYPEPEEESPSQEELEEIKRQEEEKKAAEEAAKVEAEKKAAEEAAKAEAEKKAAEEAAKAETEKKAAIEAAKKEVEETVIASLKAQKYKTTGIKLTWKKNSALEGYEIYRSTKKNSGYKKVTSVTAASYTLKKGLSKNKTYYYRVRGYKTIDGEPVYTPYSRIVVNLNKTRAIKAITIDSAKTTISGKKVTLTWVEHESMYSLKGYKIYQSTKAKSGYKLVKIVKSEKVTIKNLKKGKTYYFRIQGYVKVSKKTVNTKSKRVKVKIK